MTQLSIIDKWVDGVTGEGNKEDMFFRAHYDGPAGATFELLIEPHHTKADILHASRWLRHNKDVVSISFTSIEAIIF